MTLVNYHLDGPVATITMDDGRVNALSLAMLTELRVALDRAEADRAVVVLTGRPGVFSAGFDLGVMNEGGYAVTTMVRAGFELAERVLTFPFPVVIACPGHAVAMGVFLLLSGDHRLGAAGPFKLVANEVAIGLTMPHAATEVLRQRLTPAAFNRAAILAEPFAPDEALAAGFVDEVVEPDQLAESAQGVARRAATLDLAAHAATKLRARRPAVEAIRAGLAADLVDLRGW